jgi:hypothetical protein
MDPSTATSAGTLAIEACRRYDPIDRDRSDHDPVMWSFAVFLQPTNRPIFQHERAKERSEGEITPFVASFLRGALANRDAKEN